MSLLLDTLQETEPETGRGRKNVASESGQTSGLSPVSGLELLFIPDEREGIPAEAFKWVEEEEPESALPALEPPPVIQEAAGVLPEPRQAPVPDGLPEIAVVSLVKESVPVEEPVPIPTVEPVIVPDASLRVSSPIPPAPGGSVSPGRSRRLHWIVGSGIALVCGLGAAGYFYLLLFEDGLAPAGPRPVAVARGTAPAPPPAPPPAPVVEPPPSPPPPSPPSAPPAVAEPSPVIHVPEPRPEPPKPPPEPPPPPREKPLPPPPEVTSHAPRWLREGRQAFLNGDLATARQRFEAVLEAEPHNHSAMASLASVEIRETRYEQAAGLYRSILRENPQDSLAIAGLVSLADRGDPARVESRLRQLIGELPNAVHLHFVLGNLLVEQRNWPEAQQAFFSAYRLEPDNPDIVFNLAVCLDRMGQERTALRFYQEALRALAVRGGAGFDEQGVKRRIAILERAGPGS
ncbi:MAG: tetratricopeptide repeat protein [Magnetococcales bacterium]|nr:tetratricopeptide repeat protein [Magnetococcales bacterium]